MSPDGGRLSTEISTMSNSGLPPRFKPWLPARLTANPASSARARHRTSPRQRGYDAYWDKISRDFRRSHPWCLFCQQEREEGAWELTAVTDHVLPAHEFPELRYRRANWIPLCEYHHNHTKQRMEDYARKHDCLPLLRNWCDDPMSRPAQFRPVVVYPGPWIVPHDAA